MLAAPPGWKAEAFAVCLIVASVSGWPTSNPSYQGPHLSAEDDLESGAQAALPFSAQGGPCLSPPYAADLCLPWGC